MAVDVQPKMVEGLQKRARRAGLSDRIEARVAPAATMALDAYDNAVDFVLAFAVVHETPSAEGFFAEAARAMKPGASLLLAEPAGHVSGGRRRLGESARRRHLLKNLHHPDKALSD